MLSFDCIHLAHFFRLANTNYGLIFVGWELCDLKETREKGMETPKQPPSSVASYPPPTAWEMQLGTKQDPAFV